MRRLWLVGTFTLVVAYSVLGALAAPSLTPDLQDAHWIWLKGFEETPNATVYLAKAFNLSSAPDEAVARITCDDHYKMWVNGTFAAELEGLDRLRREGGLTEREFRAAKAMLLGMEPWQLED